MISKEIEYFFQQVHVNHSIQCYTVQIYLEMPGPGHKFKNELTHGGFNNSAWESNQKDKNKYLPQLKQKVENKLIVNYMKSPDMSYTIQQFTIVR